MQYIQGLKYRISTDFRQFQDYGNLTGLDVGEAFFLLKLLEINTHPVCLDGYCWRLLSISYSKGTTSHIVP